MRAIITIEDAENTLAWDEVERPAPGPGCVLLRVAATAVNRADLSQRAGTYPPPPGASSILGLEASGTIAALGEGVTQWKVGEPVCALLSGGGYAEYVVVPQGHLLPVPERLTLEQAAALPEVLTTAYLNLFIEGGLMPGEVAMLHAGASGVGTAAIQLCRELGNPCITTSSGDKIDVLRELGASLTLDRRADDFDFVRASKAFTKDRGVDVILDPVGGGYLPLNVKALAPQGRLVIIGLLGGPLGELPVGQLMVKRLRVIGSVLRSRTHAEKDAIIARLREHIWPLVAAGRIQPIIDRVLPIQDAQQAHEILAANDTVGKIVLRTGHA
jgi:putative PIG3 family NAD(P)H quinone oxidoreductase